MKKLALTIVGAAAVAGVALGQGDLSWVAPSGNLIVNTNSSSSPLFGGSGSGGTAAATAGNDGTLPNSYYYELLYNTSFSGSAAAVPTLNQLLSSWKDTGLEATNGLSSNGRIAVMNSNPQATVPWAQGVTNNILLVGWSADLGTSWGTVSNELATQTHFAANSFFGVSVTGYLTPNTAPANGAQVFGVGATQNGLPVVNGGGNPMMLFLLPGPVVVPEPATLALAGLGGLSLLLFRRQRK